MSQTTVPSALESPTTEGAKALKRCSKRELAELVKGEKVNLFTGQPPNAAYLFPVPIKLVKHFSPKWKHQLEAENAKVLYLTAHKDAIKLVVEWMLAGGVDSNAKGAIPYPNSDPLKLLCLNKHVAFLEIDFLKNPTLKRIDNITRNQPLSFEQMMILLSVVGIPSDTHSILERNFPRWIAALHGDEWKRKFSQASAHSEQKPAVIILGKLRLAVEENWDKKKSQMRPKSKWTQTQKARESSKVDTWAYDGQVEPSNRLS
ncbi:hypothetical protein MMC07_007198 [Pseudocyphellaria aurata]|nr:hypothetical protein [Pseudocyphellaria aurata]